jgi:hypothetical protein
MLINGQTVWDLCGTHGLPLDFVIETLYSKGTYPTWKELLEAAKRDGSKISRLIERLKIIVADVYSVEDARYCTIGLELLGKQMERP